MKTTITGKDFALTDGVKSAVESQVSKLEKFIGEDATVEVKLGAKGKNIEHCKVELTVKFNKKIVRVEVTDNDMYKAISMAVDIASGRIKKLKDKAKKKAGKRSIRNAEMTNIEEMDAKALLDLNGEIEREKVVKAEVMTREEACIEMEYTDHDFYVFKDIDRDEELCVMYKRKWGGYGVLSIE